VKRLMRGLGLALLVGVFFGPAGCGTDNDTEAARGQANLGAPPPSNTKNEPPPPAPKNMEDYAKQRKDPFAESKYGGGAKK
jgi:hypothetical protein